MEKIKRKGKSTDTMKKLVTCVGEYKRPSILTSVFVTMEVILEVLIPLIMAQIISVGMDTTISEFTFSIELGKNSWPVFTMPTRTSFIVVCGVVMMCFALVSLCFGALSGRYAAIASSGFAKNIRKGIYYKVQDFSFANLDHFNTAGLVTRLTTDVTNAQFAYMMVIRILVRAPLMLVLALAMTISIDAEMSIIFAVAIPILVIGLLIGVKVVFPRFEKMLKKYDDMNESTQENLTGIRAVKAFVREDYEIKRFKRISEAAQQLQFKAEKVLVIAMPLLQIVVYACIVAIVWFGGNKIIAGKLDLGYLSALLNYVMQILMSLMMVAMCLVMVVMSRASAERIVEVFDEKIDIEDKPDASDEKPADGSIDFVNVDFSYSKNPDVLNLEDINLHIRSGETVGIIGGTGSAKTTLVQLLPRLYDVQDGAVLVGGRDVRDYKLNNLRDAVGMVLQKNVLFSGTIKDNLKWGNPDATDEEVEHAAKVAQAHDFITGFEKGYDTDLGQGGVNVSGGQKQRLCIARALLKKPKVMILDDSTSAVDTATDAKIREGLKKEFGDITVLIIAQRIASVENADKIIVMDNGKISAVGTHDELLKSSHIYQDVYYSQQKGVADND